MMIAVQLDKRDDFDRLWRYAKSIQIADGPSQGYFPSFCNGTGGDTACNDPFGLQQFATALLLARGRWQSSPGTIDYGQAAGDLLDLIRHKESYSCGVVDGVTGTFDPKSKLVYDTPTTASANLSRPSIVMPAYYELWAQATGDSFWSQAAAAARAYWQVSANPTTGLIPERATFDGTPVPGFDTFVPECDRTFFNMALASCSSSTPKASRPTAKNTRSMARKRSPRCTTCPWSPPMAP
jgi:oligosaccharide reducing-end xylanase